VFEIGSSLREARTRKGLDFPEIESGTKIRGKYLRALEDEQFEVLPAEPYVKGFLRGYADYLGLDGQLYVDEYNSRYVAAVEEPQPIRARRTARPQGHRKVQSGAVVLALVGIAVVTALIIGAWKGSPSKEHVVGVSPSSPTTNAAPKAGAPAHIVLRALQPTTILSVRKGGPSGKVLLENEQLKRGEKRGFTTRKLWINTGTPENVRVVVNGKRIPLPGGQPQVFIVTARGIFASA
jgi:hypothetical protein